MTDQSQLVSKMTAFIYPYVVLLGFYIILNGHLGPGGGFQGGAVLATLVICRYLVSPREDMSIKTQQLLEKVFFILIVLLPIVLLFNASQPMNEFTAVFYLIVMNTLIGLKVCVGLTIIAYRFLFYEGGNRWTL